MNAIRFVDTNILIYAVSVAAEDADKTRRALALLKERDLALSVQVLQEFYVQATLATRLSGYPAASVYSPRRLVGRLGRGDE